MAITPLPTPPSRSAPSTFSTLADALLGALPTFVTEANAQAAALELNDTTDASASSAAIGTGAKTFVVTAGKSFQPGMSLMIADDAAPSTNWMHGQVTSYSGTTLVMNITAIGGSGTKTAWIITFSAPTGMPTTTAESDFIVSGGSPFAWVKKTLLEVKALIGLVPQATGFTLAGGTSSKTLTVAETMTLTGYASAAEITAGTEPAKAIAPDQLALSKYNWPFATAAEITAGTEPAKAIAPDQLALSKYNNWSFATADEITTGTEPAKAIAPDQAVLALMKKTGSNLAIGSDADGDMYYRASGVLARLAKGTANFKMFMNAAGTAPQWASGSKLGTFTRDVATVSGDVSYTGVGFKPSVVILMSTIDATSRVSIGLDDGTTHYCVYGYYTSAGEWRMSAADSIRTYLDESNYHTGKVKTMDADGFTVTWTKTGILTGNLVTSYLALR